MKIYFATGNRNKFIEVQQILDGFDVNQLEIDLPELQGEPEEISLEKALIACQKTGMAVCVEDTSLVFNAWNGLPGPYIKHFMDKLGMEGLYKMLEPYEDKSAYAQVVVGYCEPGQKPLSFVGRVYGTIVSPSEDTNAFRFDRIFIPDGYGRRFAEMSLSEKNAISHRRRAFDQFANWLRTR